MDRTVLALALIFGVPPGVGVALATLRVTGGENLVLAILAGAIVGIATVVFVLLLAARGSVETVTR